MFINPTYPTSLLLPPPINTAFIIIIIIMEEGRACWSNDEIKTMLDFIKDKNGYKLLDSKRQRNIELYNAITGHMKARGFTKTPEQCRSKFKVLKAKYLSEKMKASRSGE